MNVELTKGEIAVLLQLVHIAVQARGMEVAEAGVVLSRKLNAAMKTEDLPELPPQPARAGNGALSDHPS